MSELTPDRPAPDEEPQEGDVDNPLGPDVVPLGPDVDEDDSDDDGD